MAAALLDAFPVWVTGLFTLVLCLASFELGRRLRSRRAREDEAALGTLVGASLGLLAFFLAFTFGLAASRFDQRRQLVLDEANAIGTAYLRTRLVPEPHSSELRKILREYTADRIEAVKAGKVDEALARAGEAHRRLWNEVTALGQADPHSIVAGLLIEALNEVIDLHEKRVTVGLRARIPGRVWDVLFVLTVVAMLIAGFHAAGSASRPSAAILLVAFAFASVILVVADLDRPGEGSLRASQQALIDTLESMDPY
jgi:hypothetical protein